MAVAENGGTPRPHLFLIGADSIEDAVCEALAVGGVDAEIERVTTVKAARAALDRTVPSPIVVDERVSGLSGLHAALEPPPRIIVLCHAGDEGVLRAVRDGAFDAVRADDRVALAVALRRALRALDERRQFDTTLAELRRIEERYGELVENANDIVLMTDLQGNFTEINRAAEVISGYTREQVRSMNMAQVLTPESYQRALQMIGQKLKGQEATVYELDMVAQDGHHVPLELSTKLMYHGGVPVGVQGIARDITERKRSELALAESEARYRGLFENASDIMYTHDLEGNFTSINGAAERLTGYTRDEVLQLNIADIVAPDHVRVARAMTRRKLVERSETTYELDIVAKDGHRTTVELNSQLIYQEGRPIGVQGIARDVTERRRAEQELRSRERKQAAVAQLGQHALVSTDLAQLLTDTVSWVVRTLDIGYCTVLELSGDGQELIGRAGAGWDRARVGEGRVPAGPLSFAGYTLIAGEPVVVHSFSAETRFTVPRILLDHEVESGMSVIISGTQRPFGVLTVFTAQHRYFSRDDVHFLQAVANVLAAAIERKRLEEERARHTQELATRVMQAQEEERKRIARELHDDTAQSLSMLLTNLDLLEPAIDGNDMLVVAGFRRIAGLARRTLDAVRALSHDLRPTILDDAGLEAALEWVAAEYERTYRGAAFVDTRLPDDARLTPEIEVALFRIAQEALTNSGKHAAASTVWIRLRIVDGAAVLTVEDDGTGFDADAVPRPTREGRLGLYGMRERAALFGGSLTVDTVAGQGTTVRATLPLPTPPPALPAGEMVIERRVSQ